MKKQTFTVRVTRAEFLKLPMNVRRRALAAAADKIIESQTIKANDLTEPCSHGISARQFCPDCEAEHMLKKCPDDVFQHGVNCPKHIHSNVGRYLHDAYDDSPYDVDGVKYCGRCHTWIP